MFRGKKKNKAKLEHKLYLAKETPEPIFDISECDLTSVPSGIYSLCKVFLKERLDLQQNNLTSLSGGGGLSNLCGLKVLDISYNYLTSVPDEIDQLINLQELYVNNNQLKTISSTLCKLKFLQILDLSNNCLKKLPNDLGCLINLLEINIEKNNIIELPKSFGNLQSLQSVKLDIESFVYPSKQIIEKGTEAIKKFICEDTGIKYTTINKTSNTENHSNDSEFNLFNSKDREFLKFENESVLLQKKRYDLDQSAKIKRKNLLEQIVEKQTELDEKLIKLQKEKEVERFKLIKQMLKVQENLNFALKHVSSTNEESILKLMKQKSLEEKNISEAIAGKFESLEKNKILADMKNILLQENKKFEMYEKLRDEINKKALKEVFELNNYLENVLSNQDLQKTEFLSLLEKDAQLQKAAVGKLLEKSDIKNWTLLQKLRMIEIQLSNLTAIELERKKFEVDQYLDDITKKREDLSLLLTKLCDEHHKRKAELLSTLNNVEESNDHTENFWLKKYQLLLERMPNSIFEVQNINPNLVQRFISAGMMQYLPMLTKLLQDEELLKNITKDDIAQAGVSCPNDCVKIYEQIKLHTDHDLNISEIKASAPPYADMAAPSAPSLFFNDIKNQCVICMEQNCEVIFIPCGHYCCCTKCSDMICDCPLCRKVLTQKVKIYS